MTRDWDLPRINERRYLNLNQLPELPFTSGCVRPEADILSQHDQTELKRLIKDSIPQFFAVRTS